MSAKNKNAATFNIQIQRLTLANTRLVAKNATLAEELKFAKDALLKIKAGLDARVRTALKMNIQNVLSISDNATLKLTEGATIPELEQMFENYSLAVDTQKTPYDPTKVKTASIRVAGAAAMVPGGEDFTVGNLYGKTREEIRDMKGDH